MKLKDRLNSENKAMWLTLQYRYRNYIEMETAYKDMSDDELNAYLTPLLTRYQKMYKPLRVKVKPKKTPSSIKVAKIRDYIQELEKSLEEQSKLEGKYAFYEQGIKETTRFVITQLQKIIED